MSVELFASKSSPSKSTAQNEDEMKKASLIMRALMKLAFAWNTGAIIAIGGSDYVKVTKNGRPSWFAAKNQYVKLGWFDLDEIPTLIEKGMLNHGEQVYIVRQKRDWEPGKDGKV